jgi:hypothetical protein
MKEIGNELPENNVLQQKIGNEVIASGRLLTSWKCTTAEHVEMLAGARSDLQLTS